MAERPPLSIEARPIAELRPDPRNARAHDERNLRAIRASLARFGQRKPIVIDEAGQVIAGNGTLAAAIAEGWDTIDCVTFAGTPDEAKAFAIADNRTAELAAWDELVLLDLLDTLPDDLALAAGFTPDDVAALLKTLDDTEGMSGDAETETSQDGWGVVVTCVSEAQQLVLMERLDGEGYDVRAMIQ